MAGKRAPRRVEVVTDHIFVGTTPCPPGTVLDVARIGVGAAVHLVAAGRMKVIPEETPETFGQGAGEGDSDG